MKETETLVKRAREAVEREWMPDELLAALTTAPASIFGLQDRLGTVSEGKIGNLVLMTGPLEEKKSQVRYLFVDGERFTFRTTDKADKEDEEDDEARGSRRENSGRTHNYRRRRPVFHGGGGNLRRVRRAAPHDGRVVISASHSARGGR